MRCCVLHVDTVHRDSTFPTFRMTRFLSSTLCLPHAYDLQSARGTLALGPYDIVFMKPGTWRYSEHRVEALELCRQAKQIVILENDYSWRLDPVFLTLGKPMGFWTTVRADVAGPLGREVNWNVLTWNYPAVNVGGHQTEHDIINPGLIYWGVFRGGRNDEFSRFFRRAPYPVTIGTNTFGITKWLHFADNDPNIKVMNLRSPQIATVKQYAATIYVEDAATRNSDNFAQLANRFYEAMECGILMFISDQSVGTFLRAGFTERQIEPFVVDGPDQLKEKLSTLNSYVLRQLQGGWHVDYVRPLETKVLNLYRELFEDPQ